MPSEHDPIPFLADDPATIPSTNRILPTTFLRAAIARHDTGCIDTLRPEPVRPPENKTF